MKSHALFCDPHPLSSWLATPLLDHELKALPYPDLLPPKQF
jgi:hypothetical protein